MGHFSNSTEDMRYQDEYCDNCVNQEESMKIASVEMKKLSKFKIKDDKPFYHGIIKKNKKKP